MQRLSPIANDQGEAFEEENDEDEVELHDNTIGDLDVYNAQEIKFATNIMFLSLLQQHRTSEF